jgi:hypothetical protein
MLRVRRVVGLVFLRACGVEDRRRRREEGLYILWMVVVAEGGCLSSFNGKLATTVHLHVLHLLVMSMLEE